MNKTIYFYYKRDSLPHSEYQVTQSLAKFKEDNENTSYKISTSTACIFYVVRAFCYMYNWELRAYYENLELKISEDMRMNQWSLCPDLEIIGNCLEVLLAHKDDEKK